MAFGETNDNEADIFFDAVKDVKRLEHNLAEVRSHRRLDRTAHVDGAQRMRERSQDEPLEEIGFVKAGIQMSVLRRLRKGQIAIEEELDLHGYTVSEAETELSTFLLRARAAGRQRAVRVIHGKGIGSPNGKSVLKEKVHAWLRQSDAVLAACWAGPAGGGTGAVHVLLKRR